MSKLVDTEAPSTVARLSAMLRQSHGCGLSTESALMTE